jgi:hypothetical protein
MKAARAAQRLRALGGARRAKKLLDALGSA